jgi:hypothetical protein
MFGLVTIFLTSFACHLVKSIHIHNLLNYRYWLVFEFPKGALFIKNCLTLLSGHQVRKMLGYINLTNALSFV